MGTSIPTLQDQIDHSLRLSGNPPRYAYAIIAPWLVGAVVMICASYHFHNVAARQRVAEGTIVGHEPRNHNQYVYRFNVDGRDYHGRESPRSQPLVLGQRVQVYYDPADPQTNALTDFAGKSLDAFGPVPLLTLACGGVLGVIFKLRRRARIPLRS